MALHLNDILQPLVGTIITPGYVMISNGLVLDTNSGTTQTFLQFLQQQKQQLQQAELKDEVDIVQSVDSMIINLQLATDTTQATSGQSSGFLIEVYLSGSTGALEKVYKNDVIDQVTGVTLQQGFSSDFILETDVEE